jgi:SAM-dependent methyltransferase
MATEKSPLSAPEQHFSAAGLRSFWDWTGSFIQPFFGAPSTRYYFECERILFETFLPDLRGKSVFKTDLWDEAKNTRILNWVAEQGARAFGLDISEPIAREARSSFAQARLGLGCIISDLRAAGFKDGSFDYIYSMGTIEHFPEYGLALEECYRLLKKGGLAIIGVPNKFDPFLRPVLVSFLQSLNLYAFGEERSFGMNELGRLLQAIGFRVIGRSGILFMPGWLRLVDLFWHLRWPRSNFLLAPLILPFAFLYRKCLSLRRWGYLIACVVQKP